MRVHVVVAAAAAKLRIVCFVIRTVVWLVRPAQQQQLQLRWCPSMPVLNPLTWAGKKKSPELDVSLDNGQIHPGIGSSCLQMEGKRLGGPSSLVPLGCNSSG